MLDPSAVIGLNLVFVASGTIATLSGFGFALISIPFAVAILPPDQAVPAVLVAWLPLAILLALRYRRDMQLSRMGWLLSGAAIGIPVGVAMLATLPADVMRAAIGYVTLGLCLILLIKHGAPLRHERFWQPVVGLISGTIGGSCGIPGPPVVLFGLKQNWVWQGFRADLIGYFLIINCYQAMLFGGYDMLTQATVGLGLASLPGVIGGYFLGLFLSPKVSQQRFRGIAFAIVICGAIIAIVRAV